MLLTGPFAMLSMPLLDFHLPPCTEGFLIHLSPLWQLPLWQLPLFPSVAQFPCVGPQGLRAYFQSDPIKGQRSFRGQVALEMAYGYQIW